MSRQDRPDPFRILFVCTGNTCRSPMAEVLARKTLAEWGWTDVEIASAGVGAITGAPATEGAKRAAAGADLDLSDHGSLPLTPERVERADLILVMSPAHLEAVRSMGGEDRAALLTGFAAGGEGNSWAIPDPFGGDDETYREIFEVIRTLVRKSLRRLEPLLNS